MDGLKLMLYTAHNKICRLFIGSSIIIFHVIYWLSIFIKGAPLGSTHLSDEHISSTQKGHSSSAHKIRQLNTKKAWVQHTRSFKARNVSSKHPSVPHKHALCKTWVALLLKCGTEGWVQLTGVLKWRFFVLNWRILGGEKERLLCWTDYIGRLSKIISQVCIRFWWPSVKLKYSYCLFRYLKGLLSNFIEGTEISLYFLNKNLSGHI